MKGLFSNGKKYIVLSVLIGTRESNLEAVDREWEKKYSFARKRKEGREKIKVGRKRLR